MIEPVLFFESVQLAYRFSCQYDEIYADKAAHLRKEAITSGRIGLVLRRFGHHWAHSGAHPLFRVRDAAQRLRVGNYSHLHIVIDTGLQ